ncbi:hypothetical protein CWI39_0733p0010 [Hamiltosporidium magnivora]|uniref:Uncharacterized protein n=1 Tax=Hamiltosporidium magnivora TaxID=148818 RepID=A0A4Q9LB07_9MICR|nr:hypothetical protein CWI39_0733p0010 [Hamiltosporidium magnivora]
MYATIKDAKREFMARNVAMQALNEKLMKDQIKVLNLWADYFEGYLNEKTKKGKRVIFSPKKEKVSGEDLINAEILKYEETAHLEEILAPIFYVWKHERCQSIEIRSL